MAATAAIAIVASPLALVPSATAATSDHLVISEVYGAGGNSGAAFNADFVELYNPTASAISLANTSIQYRSATGTGVASGVTPLAGSIAPHTHYLVVEAGGATGAALPAGDATGTVNMSATTGTVFLARGTAALNPGATGGSVVGDPNIVDLVGFGTSNTFETRAAAAPSATTSISRNAAGDDTDDNSADLTAGAPSPENSGGTSSGGGGTPTEKTIEEIQGNTDTSPLVDQNVITKGVVTASYPTGGFKGFYIQTPGTGGDLDLAGHDTSDAVFVYMGNIATSAYPQPGSYVSVTGKVSEYLGLTELNVTAARDVSTLPDPVVAPKPVTSTWPTTDARRESLEGMLYQPSGAWTVSDNYQLNNYGTILVNRGSEPLRTPTDAARPGVAAKAVEAENASRELTLDDGAGINFLSAANQSIPLPWITQTDSVRVGAAVTFTRPGVVDYRNSVWNLQPLGQQTAADADGVRVASFSNTRTAHPRAIDGSLKVASFNVENFFTTTAADWTATAGNTCSSYKDRDGNPITVNTCNGSGPRGAWDVTNRLRQQAKEVTAINALGADVLSLEEIENSVKFGKDRDQALGTLVDALNADAGSKVWTYVPSPAATELPALGTQDVIRTAFIYKAAKVEPVGASHVLTDAAFDIARQPLAQVFKPAGATADQQFLVVVNHFKSKGSGTGANADQGDGQGASNPARVAEAHALVDWVDRLKTDTATPRVFLTGDFNSYTQEDPMQVLYDAGYTDIGSAKAPEDFTYVFGGRVGSLDHVLGNADAMSMVRGATVWNINSVESVAYDYSRSNYNATDFYAADPYRASDHDPMLVGFDPPTPASKDVTLNLLNINDFHGRLDDNTTKFATTVEKLRQAAGEDHTLFLSAGDNVGASLFASASADDNPTIDVLNALGLDASSVGNHEFDKGYADLTGHIQGRADWAYLGANVYRKGTTTPALPEYQIVDRAGLRIGVIGAITQEAPSLVTPAGISTLDFGDPVAAVNRVATQLTDGDPSNGEADVLVAELHEGAGEGTPDGATFDQELAGGGAFANIVNNLSPKVAAIFTGHTHKQYAWNAPIPGEPGRTRPIMQTGEYGNNVGQVVLTIDRATDQVTSYTQSVVPRSAAADVSYPRVAAVKTIVDQALTDANAIGSQPKGSVDADITTAYAGGSYIDGRYAGSSSTDPKAGRDQRDLESTLGNLVADALLDNLTENGAEIGVVNPGGLRDELFHGTDGVITYAEANAVLPFVNNLWTVRLTGTQFKTVLEQQWQPVGSSRPFLHLGLSKNVSVTLDPSAPAGSRVTSVRVNGEPLDPARIYTVGTFSFLATGGDNFAEFRNGVGTDTGKIDRDAWIGYLEGHPHLQPAFDRREVEGTGIPSQIDPGQQVAFDLGRLDLTSLGSPQNTSVDVVLRTPSGDISAVSDLPVADGAAHVAFTAQTQVPAGSSYVVTARPSGTTVTIPATASVVTPPGAADTTTSATITPAKIVANSTTAMAHITVSSTGKVNAGSVTVSMDGHEVATGPVKGGSAKIKLPVFATSGEHTVQVSFSGTPDLKPSSTTLPVTVVGAHGKG